MPTKLILIRHGVTAWNLKKKYCGRQDVPLSPEGRKQARKLCRRLRKTGVSHVYASDRKRAIQTANIVFKNIGIKTIPALREIHFGVFEGKTHDEILRKHGPLYQRWLKNPLGTPIPGGEDMKRFKKRLWGTIKAIARRHADGTIAVVCHGGVISMLVTHLKKSKNFWKYIPGSASISTLSYSNNSFEIISFDDREHL
ncbi:MAG: histidine phosphatase family protein [Candidatus Omnitrophica bacterium]|nr:histidine phosphatase family protein [Candidatus Omnitrophota bacterium]MDD5574018.1 histidine phosphatase family protein [Candidatus Omnitrophota bacterium]